MRCQFGWLTTTAGTMKRSLRLRDSISFKSLSDREKSNTCRFCWILEGVTLLGMHTTPLCTCHLRKRKKTFHAESAAHKSFNKKMAQGHVNAWQFRVLARPFHVFIQVFSRWMRSLTFLLDHFHHWNKASAWCSTIEWDTRQFSWRHIKPRPCLLDFL